MLVVLTVLLCTMTACAAVPPENAELPASSIIDAAASPLPPIAGSPSATTIFASWTTGTPSATKLSCGTSPGVYDIQAVDNGIQTRVTDHWAIVAGLTPSTKYYCRALSGGSRQFTVTTAAPPPSTPLVSVTFGMPSRPVPSQNSGDFYANCVSNDNVTYVATDDIPSGWGGAPMAANMSVNKFIKESPLTGANGNALSNFGGFAMCMPPDTKSPKIIGMYCDAGNIYVLYSRLFAGNCAGFPPGGYASLTYGNILKSPDHGASWSNFQAPGKFNPNGAVPSPVTDSMFRSDSLFASASFVGYGIDDGTPGYRVDNADAYAYLISNDGVFTGTDHIYLARIPRQSLPGLDAKSIQYYIGGVDGSLDAAWSSSIRSIAPLQTWRRQLSVPVLQYMPSTGRYLMFIVYDASNVATNDTWWMVYEAPHPWGPFTLINGPTEWTPQGFYNPVPLQRSIAAATPNGTPMTLLMAGDYRAGEYYQLWTISMIANTH